MGPLQEVAFKSQHDVFARLANVGNIAALSPQEKRWCEADLKRARDLLGHFRTARETGFEEGHNAGLKEGRAEGHAKGRAEGRAEGSQAILEQAVRSMRANGLDNAMIARFLNISLETVEAIR